MLKTEGFGAVLEVEMLKKCTPLWLEAHIVKMWREAEGFGAVLEVEMLKKCILWRSTFGSKCTKTSGVGPLLEVEMLKKCTPLWLEAHFEVKMYKTPQDRTAFGS